MDGTGRLFGPLLRALPPGLPASVVAYPTDKPLSYAELLPLVESAAAECGEFVVVGESFSGPLAHMLAARRPPGLRGLVLCASFVRFPFSLPKRWPAVVQPWMFRLPVLMITWALLGRHRNPELCELLGKAVREVSADVFVARAQAMLNVDVAAELRACSVPVLYLRARGDKLVPSGCRRHVQELRPDADLAELDGPHLLLQAMPRESAAVLVSFCERVAAARRQDARVAQAASY